MPSRLKQFETLALALATAAPLTVASLPDPALTQSLHPFDARSIYPKLPSKVKRLFDDGHFAEATSHAFKYLDKQVEKLSGLSDSGFSLMMDAFDSKKPKIKLTPLSTQSENDEQEGYRFVFAGAMRAIRNPRAHEFCMVDDPDTCLRTC